MYGEKIESTIIRLRVFKDFSDEKRRLENTKSFLEAMLKTDHQSHNHPSARVLLNDIEQDLSLLEGYVEATKEFATTFYN